MSTPQLLQISPPRELVFQGPFTDVVTSNMSLKNGTDKNVCFKIKTTAPKQYCVRPNSGLLKPGDSKTVTVMLQPLDGGIPSDANRHKFMVQSAYTASDNSAEVESIWKTIDQYEITYSKLMVVFVDKKESDENAKVTNGTGEESFTSIQSTEIGAAPQAQGENGLVNSLRKSLRTAIEEKQELRVKVDSLTQELESMLKKNRNLQANQRGESDTPLPLLQVRYGGLPLQVILLAIAALLIGLIAGKMI